MVNDNPFEDSEVTTILVVEDLKKAQAFYTNVLGAELSRNYGGTSVVLKFLGSWFLLVTSGGETVDKPGTEFTPISDKNKIDHAFTIRVKDCFKSHKILEARGAQFLTPPYDWGEEVRCFFRDPSGNLFEISELKVK